MGGKIHRWPSWRMRFQLGFTRYLYVSTVHLLVQLLNAVVLQALMTERMHLGTTKLHFAREQRRQEEAGRRAIAEGQWSQRLCRGKRNFRKKISRGTIGFLNQSMASRF